MQLNAGKQLGFTIIELLAMLLIITIMLIGVVPGYQDMIRNTQATSMADRLVQSLRLAQSEAIKRGVPVTVCPISASFDPATAFEVDEDLAASEQWPCQNTSTWSAWKVFVDPQFNSTENYTGGTSPIIMYVRNEVAGSITANISGPITYDPLGFANINPATTRSGWTWSSSYSSGEWAWTNTYSSSYAGTYYRAFTVTPDGCTGDNGRLIEINQTGAITTSSANCP